jgi:coenzyme F420 hydrogenase subunit beta
MPKYFIKGRLNPTFINSEIIEERIEKSCPGKGYPIQSLSSELFSQSENIYYHDLLGYYNDIFGLKSKNLDYLKFASSGAVIPTVIDYTLNNNLVDAVLTSEMTYSEFGPIALPIWITDSKMITKNVQGSKYMPIPLLSELEKGLNLYKKIAVVGTPCQIAALRIYFKNVDCETQRKLVFTMSNFCGGFRDFRESERIISIFKFKLKDLIDFRFRGNGHPGFMSIEDNARKVKLPYPDYSGLTGVHKMKRCKLCVDATGELSDLSFGDAWLPHLSGKGFSIVMSRSEIGQNLIRDMVLEGCFEFVAVSEGEVLTSQRGNLETKKIRQRSRNILYRILLKRIPKFDGGFRKEKINILFELKVIFSQNIKPYFFKYKLYNKIKKMNHE